MTIGNDVPMYVTSKIVTLKYFQHWLKIHMCDDDLLFLILRFTDVLQYIDLISMYKFSPNFEIEVGYIGKFGTDILHFNLVAKNVYLKYWK